MFCEKCGAELPNGAAFCPKCGKRQGETESKIERIYFDVSDVNNHRAESKNSRIPVFVVMGLVIVLVAAVTTLIASVFGSGNANKVVEAAMEKTIQTLQEKVEECSLEEREFGYFFEFTGDYYQSSDLDVEEAEILEELGNVRVFFSGNISQGERDTYGSIEVGVGNMNNILLNYCVGRDGLYLALPDLYSRSFFAPKEFFEDIIGTDVEEIYDKEIREKALLSLRKAIVDTYQDLDGTVDCKRIGKETLTEYQSVQATRYQATVTVTDGQLFLKNLLERLEMDRDFRNWLEEMLSKQQVEEFFDLFLEEIEENGVLKDRAYHIPCDIYVDKDGRMVQLDISFEEETEGKLVFSFLGGERSSDLISMHFYIEDDYCEQKLVYRYQIWDENQLQSFAINKENYLEIVEYNQEELGTAVVEILYNIRDGGYFPSLYMDDLDELLMDLSMDFDKEYDSYYDYDSWEYELEFSENGNPILKDWKGKYQIELIAPPDSKLDLDWSYSTQICFMDEEEEQDYYYEIVLLTEDTADRFIAEKEYLLGDEYYTNIVFSDIMQKEINGYQVYYQYCSYDYAFMTGYKTYYAWVRLDENYVFELYLDDYTNSVGDDILDGCFQAVLPIEAFR